MKRCPECRRDYVDDSLLYCLEDGAALIQGSVPSPDEPATALISPHVTSEDPTRSFRSSDIPSGSIPAIQQTKRKPKTRTLLMASIAAIGILAAGLLVYRYFDSAGAGQIDSIAVLPFQNSSGDPDSEYLSDGLAESLIYRLSQLPDLNVSPRSSVFRYKGKEMDTEKIGAELGVDAVLSGRITQRGENLSISVDMVDVRNRKTIWGERYERKMSDLLTTQREIASTVAQRLQLKLNEGNDRGVAKKYTSSNEAYQLYLKGRHAWNQRTAESLNRAVDHYKQAISEDPGFALAYSGLAETYAIFPTYNVASPRDSMPQAKAAAMRALELDESLAEAHTAYASYLQSYEYDMVRSEAEFRRAIELDPKYATAHQWLAELLSRMKRFDEGMAEIRRAEELDPLSPVISFNIGWQFFLARRYDEAIAAYEKTKAQFPEFPLSQMGRCWALYAKGDLANAVPDCRKAQELVPDPPNTGYLAMVLARSGNTDEAMRLLEHLQKQSEQGNVPPTALAYAFIGLNKREEALRMMEREVTERGYLSTDYGVCPEFDQFRSEPRFKALLKQMNLPE